MKRWQVEFFKDEKGMEPVRNWMLALPEEVRGRVLTRVNLLAEHGPALDFPYTSQIEGRLREVRLRFGKMRYRILYFFDNDRVAIVLHAFTKDSDVIDESDKRIGQARLQAHMDRKTQRKKVH